MGFIACTAEWAGFPEGIRPQVTGGGETGMITNYLWETGWEKEMVQGGLESPVGKWCLGMGRFLTSGPNCWGRGRSITLVHIHFIPLWYPGMRNHKWLASSSSPAFRPKKVITPISPPFIAKSYQADLRGGWVSTCWHHACAAIIPHFLKGGRRAFFCLGRRRRHQSFCCRFFFLGEH